MNGRAYDYNLGRFLSVDPFIQEPGNSQSMNPYSYIMNNPLAGTDPSGYTCQGEGGGDKCKFEPEPKKKERGRGMGFGWVTAYKVDNGAKLTHGIGLEGSSKEVEKIGSQLEEKGYSLSSGVTNDDGTASALYTKTYSGNLSKINKAISGATQAVNEISLAATAIGLTASGVSNAKIIPQFNPVTGNVSTWHAIFGESAKAGMRINLTGLAGAANLLGKVTGVVAPFANALSNSFSGNYTPAEVGGKFALDASIAGIAMYIGGVPGLAIGGGYMYMDYQMNTYYGGWSNGLSFMSTIPSTFGTAMQVYLSSRFRNSWDHTRSELNQFGRDARYYMNNPSSIQRDLFRIPDVNLRQ